MIKIFLLKEKDGEIHELRLSQDIYLNSQKIDSLDNLNKIEISKGILTLDFKEKKWEFTLIYNACILLLEQEFMKISKGNSLIFLKKKKFPDLQDITNDQITELGWNVLEKFSKVTRIAKDFTRDLTKKEKESELLEFIKLNKSNAKISNRELKLLMDENGKFEISLNDLKEMIFKRGLEAASRSMCWGFLLNVYNWETSTRGRLEALEKKAKSYNDLKQYWIELLEKDEEDLKDTLDQLNFQKMIEIRHSIMKDILRTDRDHDFYQMDSLISPSNIIPNTSTFDELSRGLKLLFFVLMTYSMYNLDLGNYFLLCIHDLGYVQGMNDLLSPILLTLQSEELGFWCFVGFMDKMQRNFSSDQLGITEQLNQLSLLIKFMDPQLYNHLGNFDILRKENNECENMFICYRWILVCFKREFALEDLPCLWERIWSSGIPNFRIFVAFSMLHIHRSEIILKNGFDELLRLVNDKALHYDVNDIIWRSIFMHKKFKQNLQQILPSRLDIEVAEDFEFIQRSEVIESACTDEDLNFLIDLI